MKAIELQNDFGIKNLQLVKQPQPTPTQAEVFVKLEAVSLNYVDLLVIKGLLNRNIPLPYVPVCDGAGLVEQVGEAIIAFKPGDKVVTTFIPNWLNGKPTGQTTDYSTRPGLGGVLGQLAEYKCFHINQLIHSERESFFDRSFHVTDRWTREKSARSRACRFVVGHIPIIGARNLDHLKDNLGCLDVTQARKSAYPSQCSKPD